MTQGSSKYPISNLIANALKNSGLRPSEFVTNPAAYSIAGGNGNPFRCTTVEIGGWG